MPQGNAGWLGIGDKKMDEAHSVAFVTYGSAQTKNAQGDTGDFMLAIDSPRSPLGLPSGGILATPSSQPSLLPPTLAI